MEEIGKLHTLTVKEMAERLKAAGIEISYKTLSDLLNTGDIGEQLGITGDRNARHIPAVAVQLLIEFIPQYRENKGRLPQAAAMLRNFRELLNSQTSGEVEQITSTSQLLSVRSSAAVTSLPPADLMERYVTALTRHADRLEQTSAPDDAFLTAEQAARLLACKPDKIARYVKGIEGRRGVWRRSDVLEYIAEQKQKK